jgi:inner membrane protein
MDNLCHTLVGAALAEAGLRRRTRLAVPTLLIGANLPDLDVLSYLRDPLFALTFRRGWTHGILALMVLPPLLTGAMLAWSRLVGARHKALPVDPRALLLLSAIAVGSHALLDLLNTYGVRLLMPFSGRWFYADTLFIIDPWLWLLLAGGTILSWLGRRRGRSHAQAARPAQLALAVAAVYIAGMGISTVAGRRLVREQASATGLTGITREMVAPVPANPFERSVVLETPGAYRVGGFAWLGRRRGLVLEPARVPRGFDSPPVAAAAASPAGAAFLRWSRFPAAVARPGNPGTVVRLYDLRYAGPAGESWAAVEITVPR